MPFPQTVTPAGAGGNYQFMATLVREHTIHSFTGTAADVLRQYPDSPYAAFVVTTQDQVECYAQHCARLYEGLGALVAVDSLDGGSRLDVGDVYHELCINLVHRVTPACLQGEVLGQSVQHKARSRIKLAVSACRARHADQTHPVPIMVTAVIDNKSVLPVMCWRLDRGFPALCYLTCRVDSGCRWDVVVHAAPFAKVSPADPVQVAVVAPPRQLPHVKHTNWVLSRQQYAKLVPSSAAEGILGNHKGELLEGFISNLFIVQDSDHGLITRTASEGVLHGTRQQQVLSACKALGIKAECKAPMQEERHLWKEAFLTNAVRGLRPINHISCPPHNAIGWEPWEWHLPEPSDESVCCRVQRQLLTSTQYESV